LCTTHFLNAALLRCQEGEGLDAAVSGSDLEGLAAQNVALREALEACRAQMAATAEQARGVLRAMPTANHRWHYMLWQKHQQHWKGVLGHA
jgi:hypothetical protein